MWAFVFVASVPLFTFVRLCSVKYRAKLVNGGTYKVFDLPGQRGRTNVLSKLKVTVRVDGCKSLSLTSGNALFVKTMWFHVKGNALWVVFIFLWSLHGKEQWCIAEVFTTGNKSLHFSITVTVGWALAVAAKISVFDKVVDALALHVGIMLDRAV